MFITHNQRIVSFFNTVSYSVALATIAATVLFIDKQVFNFYVIPKQYVFICLLLLNLLVFAARTVLSRQVAFRQSVLDVSLLILLGISLLSSFFSLHVNNSFVGRTDYFVLHFVFVLFSVFFYFFLINSLTTPQRWRLVLDSVIGLGGVTALLFILKAVFNVTIPFLGGVWNVVDNINSSFGLWLIIAFVLAAGSLIKRNVSVSRALYYLFIMVLTFVPLLLMGFKILWWVLLIGLILLLLLGASLIQESRAGWLSVLFCILILTCAFIIFDSPRSLQSVLPVEISLDVKPSWSITKSTLLSGAKNFLFGSGLGTFAIDFSQYRTPDFNYDRIAWALRFNHPFNTFLQIAAEGGVLLFLGFVFVLLFVLGHVLTTWFKLRGSQSIMESLHMQKANIRIDVFLTVIVWLVLWVGMGTNTYTVSLWMAWWLFLGLIISGLSMLGHPVIKEREWTLENTPQYNLAFSFGVIVVMAAVVMVGVLGMRFYWADRVYARALQTSDFATAEAQLQKAVELHGNTDMYHVALAQVYLTRASQLSQVKPPQLDVRVVADFVARAVNQARFAADMSPRSVAVQENLATMYENAALLVPEAREWAIRSLQRAAELEPTNAVIYWRLGNNYLLSQNTAKALEQYQKAIDLKGDYVGAYIGLAEAYEANKEINQAIEAYKKAFPLVADNPDVLFHFGRLLFNRNQKDDRANAETLWLEAVRFQPGFSNALYSLGLLYEGRGDKTKALQYYYKVKDLNPDNQDIIAKIRSLVWGSDKDR